MNTFIEKLDRFSEVEKEIFPGFHSESLGLLQDRLEEARKYSQYLLEHFDKKHTPDLTVVQASFDLSRVKDPEMLFFGHPDRGLMTKYLVRAWNEKETAELERRRREADQRGDEETSGLISNYIAIANGGHYEKRKYSVDIISNSDVKSYRFGLRCNGKYLKAFSLKREELLEFLTQMAFRGELVYPESVVGTKREE